MDDVLRREKGLDPENRRIAFIENFCLVIGNRATLVPCVNGRVHGVLFSLTHSEIDPMYSEDSVKVYRPEAISVHFATGDVMAALTFNLPAPPSPDERNPQYVSTLTELAERIGLPLSYMSSIQ